jgi:hypothetical protein
MWRLNAWVAAHTVTTIKVAKLYDQTGNGRHFTQATLANMPNLTASGLNGLPVLNFPGSVFVLGTATVTVAQPFTYSTVYIRPPLRLRPRLRKMARKVFQTEEFFGNGGSHFSFRVSFCSPISTTAAIFSTVRSNRNHGKT